MSDLAFLRERARLLQADVWIVDRTLHFQARTERTGPEICLARGEHLIEIEVGADLAHQRTEVRICGYDAQARSRIDEAADDSVVKAEITGGRTGPSILKQAFGDRVSYRVRDVPLASAEAENWARAEMLRRARAFVVACGVTDGTPDLTVGSRVTLENVGVPFNGGPYYVTRLCHTFDLTHGYRTGFQAERAAINEV